MRKGRNRKTKRLLETGLETNMKKETEPEKIRKEK